MCTYTYDHHGRRHICLAILDCAQSTQYLHQRRIVIGRLVYKRGEAYGTIFPLYVEVVLERYGQAMERSYSLTGPFEMLVEGFGLLHRFIEEGIAETIGLCTY